MSLEEFVFQEEQNLDVREFLSLAQLVWPGNYDNALSAAALTKTMKFTVRRKSDGYLVGVARLLTDGYFFSTVPEILIDPAYQRHGLGRGLMDFVFKSSPTTIFLGAQPGKEGFYEKLGYEKGFQSYVKKKDRPQSTPNNL